MYLLLSISIDRQWIGTTVEWLLPLKLNAFTSHLVISNKIHVNVSVISLDKFKGSLSILLIVPSIETLTPIHIVMTPNRVKQLLVMVGGLQQSTVAVISLRNTDYSLMTIFTGPPGGTCLQNTTPMIRISCLDIHHQPVGGLTAFKGEWTHRRTTQHRQHSLNHACN